MSRFQVEITITELVTNFSNMVKLSSGWPSG